MALKETLGILNPVDYSDMTTSVTVETLARYQTMATLAPLAILFLLGAILIEYVKRRKVEREAFLLAQYVLAYDLDGPPNPKALEAVRKHGESLPWCIVNQAVTRVQEQGRRQNQ